MAMTRQVRHGASRILRRYALSLCNIYCTMTTSNCKCIDMRETHRGRTAALLFFAAVAAGAMDNTKVVAGTPQARYPNGKSFTMWPGGALGAHNWLPMAYSAQTDLVYIPTINTAVTYSDKGIDLANWRPLGGETVNPGVNADLTASIGSAGSAPYLPGTRSLRRQCGACRRQASSMAA